MSSASEFDLIVIGAGQGGDPLARAFAGSNRRVALIEKDHVGGCCVNYGCTPTKSMVAHAAAAQAVRDAAGFGVTAKLESIDLSAIRAHKDEVVSNFRLGTEKHIASFKTLDLIYGVAKFTGPKSLIVDRRDGKTQEITGNMIVINTGARPSVPSVAGLADVDHYDSTSIQNVTSIPDHLVVLGGGNIALEFGQMFRRLGSSVTIVESGARLIAREDPDVSEEIEKIFREDGIRILTGSKATGVRRIDAGFALSLNSYDGPSEVTGSHLLIAAGRTPVTEGLGLGLAGVECGEHGEVKVDEKLETTAPGVYAIGDVNGGPQFTHISYDDFRILKANLLDGESRTTTGRQIPYTMFTDPQISRVGLNEIEAKKQKLDFKVAKLLTADTARGIETRQTRGFIKALIDNKTKLILGATVICFEGGEILPIFQMAMLGNLQYTVLKDAIFAHPVQAESINNLFMALDS